MPFRGQEIQERCVLCQHEGSACNNCGASHCSEHLLEGACTACHATLWNMERRRFHSTSITAGVTAVPATAAALVLAISSAAVAPLGFAALGCIALAGLFLKKRLRPMIHNSLRDKALPPSSQRLLPAPPFDPASSAGAPKGAKERPRGLRRAPPLRKSYFKFWNRS